MRKKLISLSVAISLVMVIASVVLANPQKEPKGTITIWSGSGVIRQHMDAAFVPNFEKNYPEIKVETSAFPQSQVKITAALSAQSPVPDLMRVHGYFVYPLVEMNALEDLTDRIAPIKHEYLPEVWPTLTFSGRIYGMCEELSVGVFYYRKDIFEKYGISIPETLEDFFTAGKKLKAQGLYIDAFTRAQGTDFWRFCEMLAVVGGNSLNNKGEVILNTPEGKGVIAAEIFNRMVEEGIAFDAQEFLPEYATAVNEGKVVGHWHAAWGAPSLKQIISPTSSGYGNWRMGKVPLTQGGTRAGISQIGAIMVNNYSKNKELAWTFLDYCFHTLEGNTCVMGEKTLVPQGWIPALYQVAESSSPWECFGGQQIASDIAKVLLDPELYVLNMGPGRFELEEIVREHLSAMFAGELTPEEAINSAVKKWKEGT